MLKLIGNEHITDKCFKNAIKYRFEIIKEIIRRKLIILKNTEKAPDFVALFHRKDLVALMCESD